MNWFQKRKFKKNMQENYYNAITFPIYGALALLDSAEDELKDRDIRGINLAAAFRTPEASWSLFNHLVDDLTEKQQKWIVDLLGYLDSRLEAHKDDLYRTDGWTDAMRFYSDHEC